MKKLFLFTVMQLFVLVSFSFTLPASAQKAEWVDNTYDFTKAKRICVTYTVASEQQDGIIEKETPDWFFEQIKKELVDKLPNEYKIESQYKVVEKISAESGVGLENRNNTLPKEDDIIFNNYLKDNYDLIIKGTFLNSVTGKKHIAGYTYTTSVPKTTSVMGMDGKFTTVTTTVQEVHTSPSFDVETVTIDVRIDVTDAATGKQVWTVKERREKEGGLIFKGMFNRIVAEFSTRFRKALKTKAGMPIKKDVGF
jgi:hypothetical protein